MNKRIGITCLIILVSACLITGTLAVVGMGVYAWDRNNPRATITSAPTVEPMATNCPEDSCTVPMPGGAVPPVELPKEISRIMDAVQEEVIEIRGLHPTTTIPRALLSPDELRENVIEDFLAEYTPEDAQMDVIVLSTLGLLPSDFDLLNFYEDLYSEQVAGYYDDETKEMYVVSESVFGGPEKMTYAHEFTHILQDQNFDFTNVLGMSDEACEADSERCFAISSLIEGDASLTEYFWYYQYSTKRDQGEVNSFYQSFESPVYDSAPEYMKEDFLFPYLAGQEFVQVLYDLGGWRAVDNAYANPPVSSEQIMHPSRYPGDKPIKVELTDMTSDLGAGWEQVEANVMGEWYTYLILAKGFKVETRLDDETARDAVEGWGGDAFHIYHNYSTNQTVFIMETIWDTNRDAQDFNEAFTEYGDARWGSHVDNDGWTDWRIDDQYARLQIEFNTTRLILSPDELVIGQILLKYPGK